MRVLVTGSAGFVGSHLVERLLAEGHHVTGVDSYLSGQRRNTLDLLRHPNFAFIEGDVSRGIPYAGDELDWVLHFASPASPPHYQRHPIATLRVGAHGTEAALELARQHAAGFLLASTSEVYGDPHVHPQPEGYWGNVNPIGARACYDEAKRFAEAMTVSYHRHYGLDVRIIRIFNTYGPRMRHDDGRVVTNFVTQALRGQPITVYGDGRQTRSFQYVDDLIEGIVRLLGVRYVEPVNLGNPIETPVRTFAEIVRDAIDPRLDIVFAPPAVDDPQRRRPDIGLAERLLGWRPTVSLQAGLERTIDHFRRVLCESASDPVPEVTDVAARLLPASPASEGTATR